MANIDSISVHSTGANKRLLIKTGDREIALFDKGPVVLGKFGLNADLTKQEASTLLNDALDAIRANPDVLSPEAKDILPGHLNRFVKNVGVDGFKDGVKAKAENIEATLKEVEKLATAADKDAAEAIVKAEPKVVKFATTAAKKKIEDFKLDIAGLEKIAADEAVKVANLKTANENFGKLLAADAKPTQAEVTAFLQQNLEHLEVKNTEGLVLGDAQKVKFSTVFPGKDFDAIKKQIIEDAGKLSDKVTSLTDSWQIHQNTITSRSNLGDAASLKIVQDAQEASGKLKTEITEVLGHEYAPLVKAKLPPETLKTLEGLDSGLAASFGAAAKAGEKGKGIGGFFKGVGNWFMHDGEKLAGIAKKEAKPISELGMWSRLNKIKAGGAGVIAVVGTALLVGIGQKPGPHTEAAMSRDQDPQLAGGRA